MQVDDRSVRLIQDYINLMGKMYIILLSSLEEFFGAPLSTNEKVVLQILDEVPISMKEISTRTGLALSTLTNVIDKMEEKRLVKRRHSQKDRRMVEIELDVAGLKVKEGFNGIIKQISFTMLGILSEEDSKSFTSALRKTADILMDKKEEVQYKLGSMEDALKLIFAKVFEQ